jgi:drug/metabolite transporter (DMT)-like permease
MGAVAALACLSTAAAYLIYFRLVSEVGAAPALTVTYLIPLFGCAWGYLFLGEPVGWHAFAGGAAVLCAIALISRAPPGRNSA